MVSPSLADHTIRSVYPWETRKHPKIEGVVAGRLKTGDKIVAQVGEDRRALSIILQVPDAGSSGSPAGVR
jgi:hypothetical protein